MGGQAGRQRAAPHLVDVAVLAAQRRVELVVGVGKGVDQGQGVGPHRAHQAALRLAQPPSLAACRGDARCGWGITTRGKARPKTITAAYSQRALCENTSPPQPLPPSEACCSCQAGPLRCALGAPVA